MYEIFEKLLNERGLKTADISRATGISLPIFSYWKAGRSTPKYDNLRKIADFFNVTVDYLITGKEPEKTDHLFPLNGLSATEHTELIETYSMLSKENKECIMHIMKQLANKEG